MIRMTKAGTPDIMAFKMVSVTTMIRPEHQLTVESLRPLFIEVKRPGKKPTPLQQMKMEELESFGARCLVAHSVEEVEGVIA